MEIVDAESWGDPCYRGYDGFSGFNSGNGENGNFLLLHLIGFQFRAGFVFVIDFQANCHILNAENDIRVPNYCSIISNPTICSRV